MQHTVLILDDEKRICETLADYLTDMGHFVVCCHDGASALEALRLRMFTMAIVDMRLQDMDGNAFIAHARRLRPELRYIIHTGSLEYADGNAQHGAADRIEAVFIKPVERLQDFLEILDRTDAPQ